MNILVTGGCGFIGTNYIEQILTETEHYVINLDSLSYASSNYINQKYKKNNRYTFFKGSICDQNLISSIFKKYYPNYVINFAAESHVDNSIKSSEEFIKSNINGTHTLLQQSLKFYEGLDSQNKNIFKYHQVSTDEVYGDMNDKLFDENSSYLPSSPYSASKASADHLVRAWFRTYNLPTIITCCSNNYGPHQFPEKLIPLVIHNAINEIKIPIYGDGLQVRDWIYVEDHCNALINCFTYSKPGETYNVGSNNLMTNIELVELICSKLDQFKPRNRNLSYKDLITYVSDRPGHDRKYGINSTKANKVLNWIPKTKFSEGISNTINWYLKNAKKI